MSGTADGVEALLGPYEGAVDRRRAALARDGFIRRLWAGDAALWQVDAAGAAIVRDSLGWLRVVDTMRVGLADLTAFADGIRPPEIADVVLLGMGGSSLAPEVMRITFGEQPGRPRLHVLDTTHPDAVLAVRRVIDPARSLFVVSSKSGGTIETASLADYFWGEVTAAVADRPGQHFVAITDPGTSLERLARERGYRRIFVNPSDIGGRYSALSYFGLVPMALQGLDVATLLDRAAAMIGRCGPDAPADGNPGLLLGAAIGELAAHGRDKLTILTSPELASFGLWVEQLVAESSGKGGKGILPVAGEPVKAPETYGDDRLFVGLALGGDAHVAATLRSLRRAGQPTVLLTLADRFDLAAQFFLWEVAVATACAIIGVNAFDQPNVQEAKDVTNRVLQEWQAAGRFPAEEPAPVDGGASVAGPGVAGMSARRAILDFAGAAQPGDYLAVLAFLAPNDEGEAAMRDLEADAQLRHVAVTFGWGPRYQHSTGQLHKGGRPNGRFILVTDDPRGDAPIPGRPYSLATLIRAQTIGERTTLEAHGLPVLHVHLGADPVATLKRLASDGEAAGGE